MWFCVSFFEEYILSVEGGGGYLFWVKLPTDTKLPTIGGGGGSSPAFLLATPLDIVGDIIML